MSGGAIPKLDSLGAIPRRNQRPRAWNAITPAERRSIIKQDVALRRLASALRMVRRSKRGGAQRWAMSGLSDDLRHPPNFFDFADTDGSMIQK
jgi:hypothetical protein